MKKEKKVWALTLLSLWWLAPNQTQAQLDSVRQLNEVVITATRSEQRVIDVPRSITVIRRDEIENTPHNSVGELLANHPGMFIVGTNQVPGTNQSLFMRGANSNQMVILIDGMRITDPSTPSSTIDVAELSLAGVERIEIIRGAHSTVYGGSAIAGAINIVTRKQGKPGFHGLVNTQAGWFGNKAFGTNMQASLQHVFDNGLFFSGSILRQDVTGLNATLDTIRDPSVYKTTDADDFRKTDGYIKAGWSNEKLSAWISYKRADQHADIDDGAYNDDDNAFVDFKRNLIAWNATWKASAKLDVSLLGSWSGSERLNRNDSSRVDARDSFDKTYSDNAYTGRLLTNEIVLQYKSNGLTLSGGTGQFRETMNFQAYYFSNAFGFPYESMVNYDSLNPAATTSYVFAQASFEKGNMGITGGTRLSHHSRFGFNQTFEVSPFYRFRDVLFYASVSTGFNAPSLYQSFDPTKDFGAYTTRGNKSLKAETAISFEAGIKKEFQNGSYFTLSGFRSVTKDAIEYVYLWNNATPVAELAFDDYLGDTYVNAARQVVNGFEFAGQLNAGKFFLRGNVTALEGKVSFSPDDIDAEHTGAHHVQPYNYGAFINDAVTTRKLIRKPAVTGYAEAGYKIKNNLHASAILRHGGSRYDVVYDPTLGPFGALGRANVKTYDLIDLASTWRITNSWLLGVKIENVFDTDYREIQGFQTRGRSVYLKVQFKW